MTPSPRSAAWRGARDAEKDEVSDRDHRAGRLSV